MSGMTVSRANSVGSVKLLSRKSTRSKDSRRSMPARDDKRLERRLSVVIAGNGFRPSDCTPSIMQFERLRERRQVKVARLSGISLKRLAERSRDCRVFVSGARLLAEMFVSALSARLRCLKKRHFVEGNQPRDRRLDELPLGVLDLTLDAELPEERR